MSIFSRLISLIDADVEAAKTRTDRAKRLNHGFVKFLAINGAVASPRWTRIRLILPLLCLAVPIPFLAESWRAYYLIFYLFAVFLFFGLIIWREIVASSSTRRVADKSDG